FTTLFAANAQAGSRRKTSRMRVVEDFTGGKITRRISRATESMFQSVALMIFILIPTLTFAAGTSFRNSPRWILPVVAILYDITNFLWCKRVPSGIYGQVHRR